MRDFKYNRACDALLQVAYKYSQAGKETLNSFLKFSVVFAATCSQVSPRKPATYSAT